MGRFGAVERDVDALGIEAVVKWIGGRFLHAARHYRTLHVKMDAKLHRRHTTRKALSYKNHYKTVINLLMGCH